MYAYVSMEYQYIWFIFQGKIAASGCMLLGVCAFASLIIALIMSFLTIDYVSSHFLNYMNHYQNSSKARNIIDNIQTEYVCCGDNIWLDWTRVPLVETSSNIKDKETINTSILFTTMSDTSTTEITESTGDTGLETTTSSAVETGIDLESNSVEGSQTNMNTEPVGDSESVPDVERDPNLGIEVKPDSDAIVKKIANIRPLPHKHTRSIDPIFDINPFKFDTSNFLKQTIRRKRQIESNNGNIHTLSSSNGVKLPQSCCTSDVLTVFNSYCVSNDNNVPNNLHRDGCLNKLSQVAVSQTLAIAIIDSFLLTFALVAIPILIKIYPCYTNQFSTYRSNSSSSLESQLDDDGENNVVNKKPNISIINRNSDYSIYQ
ncbi:unnamed protein product [Rotaria sordida]|uniref:Uncharacterized protein n=1 Tax=Rotaria sordida TaxID=392033 RepID=A0A815C2B3_9BILA|nr:unnamed protein product [Rotaria sordida]